MPLTKQQKELTQLLVIDANDEGYPLEQTILRRLYTDQSSMTFFNITKGLSSQHAYAHALWRLRKVGVVMHLISNREDRFLLFHEFREYVDKWKVTP